MENLDLMKILAENGVLAAIAYVFFRQFMDLLAKFHNELIGSIVSLRQEINRLSERLAALESSLDHLNEKRG